MCTGSALKNVTTSFSLRHFWQSSSLHQAAAAAAAAIDCEHKYSTKYYPKSNQIFRIIVLFIRQKSALYTQINFMSKQMCGNSQACNSKIAFYNYVTYEIAFSVDMRIPVYYRVTCTFYRHVDRWMQQWMSVDAERNRDAGKRETLSSLEDFSRARCIITQVVGNCVACSRAEELVRLEKKLQFLQFKVLFPFRDLCQG